MLVERIKEYLTNSWETRSWSGIWNATDCTGCPRALVLIARGFMPTVVPGPWAIYKMQDGLLHEDDIKARIRLSGVKIVDPGAIMMSDAPIVCHPDGLIALNGVPYGLEIKSYGCEYFHPLTSHGIKRQSPKYYRQMQLYMRATGIKSWILEAKDRDCCELYEEVITYDADEAQRLVDNVLSAQAVLNQNLDPQAMPCGSEILERLFCPARDYSCHEPVKEIWDAEAKRAVEDWLWAKEMEAEADKIISNSHIRLRDILISSGLSVMDITGDMNGTGHKVRVYAKGQGRRVGDISVAERLLDKGTFDQIYTYKESEGPRIYRLKSDESNT